MIPRPTTQVTLYHSHAVEALSEEYLLELADWCYRKLAYLNAPDGARAAWGMWCACRGVRGTCAGPG